MDRTFYVVVLRLIRTIKIEERAFSALDEVIRSLAERGFEKVAEPSTFESVDGEGEYVETGYKKDSWEALAVKVQIAE